MTASSWNYQMVCVNPDEDQDGGEIIFGSRTTESEARRQSDEARVKYPAAKVRVERWREDADGWDVEREVVNC